MKTIICDIDGTITDMWPIEKSVLLCMVKNNFENEIERLRSLGITNTYKIFTKISKQKITKYKYFNLYNKIFSILLKNNKLPIPAKYSFATWIFSNRNKYRFVYVTGGQKSETYYILRELGLIKYFNLQNSVDKTICCFSKRTGVPFKKIKLQFSDCILVSDSSSDCKGAVLAKIPFILIKPKQKNFNIKKI